MSSMSTLHPRVKSSWKSQEVPTITFPTTADIEWPWEIFSKVSLDGILTRGQDVLYRGSAGAERRSTLSVISIVPFSNGFISPGISDLNKVYIQVEFIDQYNYWRWFILSDKIVIL